MFSRWRWVVGVAAIAVALSRSAGSVPGGQVDLNTASIAELMRVPGITEVWARRIVRYRPYSSKLALLDQGVVSQEVYQRIRDGVVARRIEKPQK